MHLWLIGLALFLGVGGCTSRKPAPSDAPAVRLAVITDLKGYLEPCGCTSRPLGGIDRMAAQIRALQDGATPLLVLLGGDLFFDTEALEPARSDQARRNAATLVGILNDLEIDAALPGARDRAQESAVITRLKEQSSFPWLAMSSDVEVLRVRAGALRVAIVGVRPGAERTAAMAAIGTAQAETDLTIAIVYGSRRDANQIASIDGVDFVVHGGLDEDQPVPPHQNGESWVIHAGRQGQGLTVVDVYRASDAPFFDTSEWSRNARKAQLDAQVTELADKIETWTSEGADPADLHTQSQRLDELKKERAALQSPPSTNRANRFDARWVELDPEAATDATVTELMKAHDKAVNEANQKAFAGLEPPPLGPDDIAYVGSQACGSCHGTALAWWKTHPHGHAYRTLETRNKQFNLDCVGCHVTGYNEPGGSTVTWNLDGALVNVGCESCHGPGAAHAGNPALDMVRNPPEETCVGCHNEEHSDQFDYETYRSAVIVPGHGLPAE